MRNGLTMAKLEMPAGTRSTKQTSHLWRAGSTIVTAGAGDVYNPAIAMRFSGYLR